MAGPTTRKKTSDKRKVLQDVITTDEAHSAENADPRAPIKKLAKATPESSKGKNMVGPTERATPGCKSKRAASTRTSSHDETPKKNRGGGKSEDARTSHKKSRSSEASAKKRAPELQKGGHSGASRKTTTAPGEDKLESSERRVRTTVKTKSVGDSGTLENFTSSVSTKSVETKRSAKPKSGKPKDGKKTRLNTKTANPSSARKTSRESPKKLPTARRKARTPSASHSDTYVVPKVKGRRKRAVTSSRSSNQSRKKTRRNTTKPKAEHESSKYSKSQSPEKGRKQDKTQKRQRLESRSSASPGPSDKKKRVSTSKDVEGQSRSCTSATRRKAQTESKTTRSKGRGKVSRSSSRSSPPTDKKKSRVSKSNGHCNISHTARPASASTKMRAVKTAQQKERRTAIKASNETSTRPKESPKKSSRKKVFTLEDRGSVTRSVRSPSTVRGKKTSNPALLKGRRKITKASSHSKRRTEHRLKICGRKAPKREKSNSVQSLSDASRSISSRKSEPTDIRKASTIRSPEIKRNPLHPRSSSAPTISGKHQTNIRPSGKRKPAEKTSAVKTITKGTPEEYNEGNAKGLNEGKEKGTSIKSQKAELNTSVETLAKAGEAGTGNFIDANAAERLEGRSRDPNGDIDGADHRMRTIGEHSPHYDCEPGQGSNGGKGAHRERIWQDTEKADNAPEKQGDTVKESSPVQQGVKEDHWMSGEKETPPQDTETPNGDECPKDDDDCPSTASGWRFIKWPWSFWNR